DRIDGGTWMIQIVDLGVRLGDIDALRTVDVSIGAGELVCLAGPNGAGKSTLLRAVVGLVRPTAGVVTVGGAAPGSGEAKQLVGYLPDAPLLYDMLTPREHLEFLDRFWGQATAVPPVDQRLAELGLADVEDR